MVEQWWLDERVKCERELVKEQQLVIKDQNREINFLRELYRNAMGVEVPSRSSQ